MFHSYQMVVINSLGVILIAIFTVFYKFIYPKKNLNLFLLLLLFSVLPVISIFRKGVYESGDFTVHVYRNISFFSSLMEGHLPSWSRDLNATYGYPTFLIEAPLGDYIPAFFHFLGFSFVTSFKLLLATTFITSGVGSLLWLKQQFGTRAGFIGGISYLYAPFHLIDLHFRVSPGDMLAYMFLPFVLYFGYVGLLFGKGKYHVLVSITVAGLLLSHPISLIGIGFALIYFLFLYFSYKVATKNLLTLLVSIAYGFLLSSFYWLPVIGEASFRLTSLYKPSVGFENILLYIYSPWRMGLLFQGPNGELSFIFGYIQWICALIALFLLIKGKVSKVYKKSLWFFIVSFILIFALLFPYTKPVWEIVPLLNQLEFSYRIVFLMVPISAGIIAILISIFKMRYLYVLVCILIILPTILNWGQRRVIAAMNDEALIAQLPQSTFNGEGGNAAAPKWVDPRAIWQKEVPQSHAQIIKGEGIIREIDRKSTIHEYVLKAHTDVTIRENTYYYPGWRAYIDDKEIPINFRDKKHPGIIILNAKPGLHTLTIIFSDTPLRFWSKMMSLVAWLFLALLFMKKLLFHTQPKLKSH